MKIIHCADIHIGSVMENLPADKAKIRKRELLDTFKRLVDFAKENNVSAIIIAGDFFDNRKVARSTKKEIIDIISSANKIVFLYLAGNHDEKTDLIYDDEVDVPDNFLVFDVPNDWKMFTYGNICIAGIDVAKQSGESFYEKLKFSEAQYNIAVLHGDLKEIRFERLKNKRINYLALGHIHIPDIETKKLDARGEYAYCGCLEGRGFDEIGERGFFLLSIENGKLQRQFYPISKRQHQIIEVDITNCDSHSTIENAVKKEITTRSKDDLIRIVLKGKYKADTQKELENLEGKLNESYFFVQIKDDSKLDLDSVNYDNEISLRHEFVNLVNESGLEQVQKEKIIEYGIKALSGEEIDL